jgi:hypothetical protein
VTPAEAHTERLKYLAMARTAEAKDDMASGSWYRLFAANFELMASDDPIRRERGIAMLKKNSDRFERRGSDCRGHAGARGT